MKKLQKELIERLEKAETNKDVIKVCFHGLYEVLRKEPKYKRRNCIEELEEVLDCWELRFPI